MPNAAQTVRRLAARQGLIRPRDLDAHGIPRVVLSRMYAQGALTRLGRGLYALPDMPSGEHQSVIEVAKRLPGGVICLLSALRLHDLTTQAPFEVWVALEEKARKPALDYPPLRVVRFSGPAFSEGVETRRIGGVSVRLYKPAKTVADCFKYRNKIGLEVALEALRECWRARKCSADELWHYAKLCRVANVMRPYLEALL